MMNRRASRVGGDMQPGARWNKVEAIAEVPLDRRGQHLMPFAIGTACSANVARKSTLVDEPRQCALRYRRCMPIGDVLRLVRCLSQRRRRDHETQPESRQQCL